MTILLGQAKNVQLAKEFIQFLFRKENYDAWIVASNAFNQPPLRNLADHPIWAKNPKFAMLPKEAEYAHERGWPAKPSAAIQLVQVNYILPDMVAKAVNGMPTKRAMAWAEDQVKWPCRPSSGRPGPSLVVGSRVLEAAGQTPPGRLARVRDWIFG